VSYKLDPFFDLTWIFQQEFWLKLAINLIYRIFQYNYLGIM
jgi:hypothetical protein